MHGTNTIGTQRVTWPQARALLRKVDVPEGARGDWKVERFVVSEKDSEWASTLAFIRSERGALPAGTYTKLTCRGDVVMSDTPDELDDHVPIVYQAHGHVLINGLGLGVVLAAVLRNPAVSHVTVVEKDADVVALVGPHYADPRVTIVHADAFTYQPPRGASYGAIWHDVWPSICSDNLPEMARLKRRYARRTNWQGCWAEIHCRRHR